MIRPLPLPVPDRDSPGQPDRAAVLPHLLMALIALVLALRHLEFFYDGAALVHLDLLLKSFDLMDAGMLWVPGEEIGTTGLYLGGPLYTWLHTPARLLSDNPAVGLHLLYFGLELGVIALWFYWPTEGMLGRHERWMSALVLALASETKALLCQNDTLLAMAAIPLFIIFLWALERRTRRSMVLSGVVTAMAIAIHQAALALLPVLLLALVIQRKGWLRLSLYGAGGLVAALAFLTLPCLFNGAEVAVAREVPWSGGGLSLASLGLLFNIIGYPAAAAGALFVGIGWLRKGRPLTGHWLALIWLLLGTVMFSLIYIMRSHSMGIAGVETVSWRDERFASLNPARALLISAVSLWILGQLRQRVPWARARWFSPPALLLQGALCAVILVGGRVRDLAHQLESDSQNFTQPACSLREPSRQDSIYLYQLFESLKKIPTSSYTALKKPVVHSLHLEAFAMSKWINRTPMASDSSKTRRPTLALMPRFRSSTPARQKGSSRHGPMLLSTNAMLITPPFQMGRKRGRVNVPLGKVPPAGERWNLVVSARYFGEHPDLALSLNAPGSAGARTLSPAETCVFVESEEEKMYYSWYLFNVDSSPRTATLSLDCKGICPFSFHMLMLPPAKELPNHQRP